MPRGWERPESDATSPETVRQIPAGLDGASDPGPPEELPHSLYQRTAPSDDRVDASDPASTRRPTFSAGQGWETDGPSSERSPVAIRPGLRIFGKYRVVESLGKGGMGEVWLVENLDIGLLCALKTMTNYDSESLARFRREARTLGRLKHDNVVQVYDARLDSRDIAYIVMEHVSGESLQQVYKARGRMPLEWIVGVLEQLCEALQLAHDAGIIHRDLKPSNLMIVESGSGRPRLKVLDFGIAKNLKVDEGTSDARTNVGAFMGSPPYTSPEQSRGEAERASDLYSTGVILYQFLTGQLPFTGDFWSVVNQTMTVPPPPFAKVTQEVEIPASIERVVMRCLAKDPSARPASPMALLAEFRASIPADGGIRVVPWYRRRSVRVAAAGVAIASAAIVAGASIPRKAATAPVEVAEGKVAPKPIPKHIEPDGRAFDLSKGRHYLPTGYSSVDKEGLAEDGYPKVLSRDGDGVEFLRIVGGRFLMGARRLEDGKPDVDAPEVGDRPPREVDVPGFYIQKHEVTNRELKAYAARPDCRFPGSAADGWQAWAARLGAEGADHPARQVTWVLAADFARTKGGRLPTEAQWEFAARSRDSARDLVWDKGLDPDGTQATRLARLDVEDESTTAKVGTYPEDRTKQGVMDLTGNVKEWCRDAGPEAIARGEPELLPDEPSQDARFVFRGGSYNLNIGFRFVTRRYEPIRRDDLPADIGFRIVIECPGVAPGQ